MQIEWNHNLAVCPRGDRVFLLLRKGEKGNGELAVGMIVTDEAPDHYWTWGGPNSGSDIDEPPVAWAPLPENWFAPLES